jgi:monovalent cation:H+ antiporter, CPA1 family
MPFQDLVVSHDLILFLFVPPLVFASASNLNSRLFFRNLAPVLILAGPGLVVSLLLVGFGLAWLTPLTLGAALLFGALISATDPVAVIALFEKLGVPPRLKMLVDGESMLNDATAIVAFGVVLGIIRSGSFQAATLVHALVSVILVLVGGALVGLLLGTLMRFLITAAKTNPLIQFATTLVLAYFSFLIADALGVSGVVAVMAAGLVIGRYKADLLKTEVKVRLDDFWELAATLANSLIFLLVGLTAVRFFTAHAYPTHLWTSIAWAILAAIAARGVMIFALTPCLNPFLKAGPINLRYQIISFWGGLRGAVALALALSLAASFPQRELLIAMTLGVALFTILVGGLTTGPLIRRFKLDTPEPVARLQAAQARFLAQQRASQRLGELEVWQPVCPEAFTGSQQFYAAQLQQASQDLLKTWKELGIPSGLTIQTIWQQALHMEKRGYQEAHDQNMLTKKTFDRLTFLLHLKDDAIRAGRIPPRAPFSEDLERPLERGLSQLLEALSLNENGPQHVDRVLKQHYEFNLAVAFVSERLAAEIRQLSQQLLAQIDPEGFAACADWYAATSQKMFQRLAAQEAAHPELFQAIQQHVLRQAVQASALERLAKLRTDGIISGAVAAKLAEKFAS